MDFLKKIEKLDTKDILWNVPEQKQGVINVIGGNSASFRTPIQIAEYLSKNFPIKTTNLILPDSLKNKLPPLENFIFLSSTDTGSFASDDELKAAIKDADYNIMIGDFSKNAITEKAISKSCEDLEKPLLITRDTVDILTNYVSEHTLMSENLIIMANMPQLTKLFRAVYYPKMLILSEPLIQVAETLHKFTLSYPLSIITIHNNQIMIAKNGIVNIIAIEKTTYSPLTFWLGEAAAQIAAVNLYNPNNFLNATLAAIIKK